jgi:hypothetical protein
MADAAQPTKPLCFVIGPIGADGSPERKHADLLLHAVIKHVLEADEFGYRVKRADEDADPGMIGDRMISNILDAELVVADLTDLNPNAFYELGIRHSSLKPAIHVARAGTSLPFDTVAQRTIFIDLSEWQSIERGRSLLAASARTINESGFQISNPLTQANATAKMRESADPRDRVIAELRERLVSVEASLRLRPVLETASPVLTNSEQKHLLNLYYERTAGYRGNHEVRSELRRLRDLTLITNTEPIGSAEDGRTFDLAKLVQLTPLGARWARHLDEMKKPHADDLPSANEAKPVLRNS